MGSGVGAVDFVDDDDRPKLVLKRLFQDESRLRHRTFGGVNQKKNAVRHAQDALDFPAEVGVAGGVDQVDLRDLSGGRVGVIDGDVLGQDGDAALALQRVAVQKRVLLHLAIAEIAALAQQSIHQRRLAMVDVGDDGNISNVVTHVIHG